MRARFTRLSAAGTAALSIWRLDAPAPGICAALELTGLPPRDRPVRVRVPAVGGGVLDEGILWRRGADVELHLHGGWGVARGLEARLREHGFEARGLPADADEERFLAARTALQARAAAALRGGAFEARLAALRRLPATTLAREIEAWLTWEPWCQVLEEPPRIVLAGPPNGGKSTLFNTWLHGERVTVSPHPGTTRDAVEAGILLAAGAEAFEVRLVDTAGLWAADDAVDRLAVAAARAELETAWRVIWVLDAARPPGPELGTAWREPSPRSIRLLHRVDLGEVWKPPGPGWLRGSALRGGVALVAALEAALRAPLGAPPPPDALLPLGAARRRALRAELVALRGGAGEEGE